MGDQKFNSKKFKELILYLATKHEEERYWGATKLNKCLFYSDFMAYAKYGQSITGAAYIALERGPAPKALVPVQKELLDSREIAVQERPMQRRILALREPDLSEFTAQEIALVDYVIDRTRTADADTLSDESHGFLGWKAARAEANAIGKQVVIPYNTVFVSNEKPDEFEEAHGHEQARRYGWPT
jgi:hypothetical protein